MRHPTPSHATFIGLPQFHPHPAASYHLVVFLSTFVLLAPHLTSSTSVTSYSPGSPNSTSVSVHHDDEVRLFGHFNEPYTYRLQGHMSIDIADVTASSIKLNWHLSNMTFSDSVIESRVMCETFTGTIVSKTIVASKGTHRFEGLESNSRYIVCVYMLEKSASSNVTVLHFSCHKAETIPLLRADSIIGVVVTLGYIFIMAAIGYFMWRKKAREVKEDKVKINIYESEPEDEVYGDGFVPAARGGKHAKNSFRNSIEKRTDSIGAVNPLIDTHNGRVGNDEAEGSNGCLDFPRNRDSSPNRKLCGLAQAEMEDRRPRPNSRCIEDSPVKVTEIAF